MFDRIRITNSSPVARPGRGRLRLTLELLEDRLAPATLTVNSTLDTASDSDPYLTLREAITIVNRPSLPTDLSTQIQGQISGSLHGGGADTIAFDPFAVTEPIVLTGTQLELRLPGATAVVTIDGGGGVTVDGNNASRVLLVDAGARVAVDHLTVSNGQIQGFGNNGGGILNAGILTLISSVISASSAYSGGAIYNSGTLTVSDSTLSGNSAVDGGGIYNNMATLTVSSSTLIANSAWNGGGIENNFGGTVTVNSSTLSANSALPHEGGGILSFGALTVSNSTLSANSAYEGGGIWYSSLTLDAPLILQNTIVAGNSSGASSGPDIYGFVQSTSSYNLVGIADSNLRGIRNNTQGNQIGTVAAPLVPRLAPLDWYGGATQTFAVLPGSAALGHGNPAAGLADQRGLPRPAGGATDIGAFQTQPDPFLVTTLTDPGRQFGLLSVREAVNLADVLPGDNTVSFSTSFDSGTVTLTQGQLELSGAPGMRSIDGGNRITLDGHHASRLFLVDAGVQAVLTRLDLGNGSSDSGGCIFNSGTLTLAYSTLYGNAAIFGGAVCNVGTLILDGSTLAYNFAYFQGGGLYNAGSLTAYNDTFLYNTAFHDGGAIYSATGSVTLTSLTISLNNSSGGGGLAVAAGAVLLRNSIVAGNLNDTSTSSSDIAGTLDASGSYNLIGTGGSGGLSHGTDHNHVGVADPGLTPPDFSSTLSPVFGFTSSSPALGAGDPSLLSDPLLRLDQHGNQRSSPPNIGAV
jgi:predicted outer membrane repeat protein